MKNVLWVCGLPNEVRLHGWRKPLSLVKTPAWSWILGHLPPEGVELHILCPVSGLIEKRVDFEYRGAHWHCFERKPFYHIFSYVFHCILVRRFVKQLAPDVVHGWGGETGFGFMATRLSKHAIVSVQGLLLLYCDLLPSFSKRLKNLHGAYMIAREKLSYKNANGLTTESDLSNSALLRYYGCSGCVIPHPLRQVFYDDVKNLRRNPHPTFLFVGTLDSRKGALDVVEAFSRVKDKTAKLVMIGDGGARAEVSQLIARKNLQDRIDMYLNCSAEEVVDKMHKAHFFALPSYGDTGPTALKEAIACGLYPVCYDNSGPHEYITKYCGYLCETGNVEAYADLMNKAIENLIDCSDMAKAASVRIKADLSRTTVWKRLCELYKKVMV